MGEFEFDADRAFQHGQFAIDFEHHTVKKLDGSIALLSNNELRLLSIVNDVVMSPRDIIQAISTSRALQEGSMHIEKIIENGEVPPVVMTKYGLTDLVKHVRQKLGPDAIKSKRGFGYILGNSPGGGNTK